MKRTFALSEAQSGAHSLQERLVAVQFNRPLTAAALCPDNVLTREQ